jgi:Domain of unknown function (DUF4157)
MSLMGYQRVARSIMTETTAKSQSESTIAPSHPSVTPALFKLQRQIGNQAVTQMLQAKMTVGKPNDAYEQEADRVADTVMRMPDAVVQRQEEQEETARMKPISSLLQRQGDEQKDETAQAKSIVGAITPIVQRQEEQEETAQMLQRQEEKKDEHAQAKGSSDLTPAVSPQLESRIQTIRGGGQPLPDNTRTFFESRFGHDFGGIRVHTDSQAAETAGQLNAQAFTIGRNVFFGAGHYEPHTSKGQWLMAHELTHTIQQQPSQTIATNRNIVQSRSNQQISRSAAPISIQRKVSGDKAPASPAQDPAFMSAIGKIKATAKQQKHHPTGKSKADEAQAAVKPPTNDVSSKAAGKQVEQMDRQQPKPFDRKAFKSALLAKIAASAPKTLEEADNFKKSGKVGALKGELTGQVGTSKQQSQGAIADKVKGAPDASGIESKTVTSLAPNSAGAAPAGINGAQAAPKPKTAAEISLQAGSQSLDKNMADADITESQLKKSNEPDFQTAVENKQQAQTDAIKAPQVYQQGEHAVLAQAQSQVATTAKSQLTGMHGVRGQSQSKTTSAQQQAKQQDEQKRTEVANELQTIYAQTKKTAEDRLTRLDTEVNQEFDHGASAAQQFFEDYVKQRMDAYKDERYDRIGGSILWAKDKLFGLPSEVNQFYERGKELYIAKMDAVLDRVAAVVEKGLTEAKLEIAKGKKAIQTKLEQQPANLRKALQQDAAELQSQFDRLEQSVDDKQNQLIDSLTQKYNEKLQAIDSRIGEMKAANKGLVDAALDAIGGVIKAIIGLKNMLLGVLSRAAAAIKKIIKDPIGFLGNLVAGVKQGFMKFIGNIATHLQEGIMGWLFGAMAEGGIQLPKEFDVKGILNLILQVLGATWTFIRARAVKILGEKVVKAMETTAEIFQILMTQGISGVWEYIKEQISHLKDVVIEGIKSFVSESIIKAGVTWIIGLLNPAGAFIKACKAIYDIIMFFVERGSQIIALVNAVIDSVSAIADGAIGVAATAVENALAKAVPVVIGFMASLLGVTGISTKIREVIAKVQAPIGKAIDWLINKAYNLVKGAGKLLGFGKSKEDREADPEHDKKVRAGLAEIDKEELQYKEEGKITREDAEKVAVRVKINHPIFKSLSVADGGNSWDYNYVASPSETKKGKIKASAKAVDLSDLDGWRPNWRKSTDEELAARDESQQYYYIRKGKLKLKKTANVNRRHKVSFEVIVKDLKDKVEGKTYQEGYGVMEKLKYTPSKASNKAIISASKSYLRDKFNDPKNVWVGDAQENQELGQQISSLMAQLKSAQNELRALRGKPKAEIDQKRPVITEKITTIIKLLQKNRLDVPIGKTVKAAQEFLDMLEAQGEKLKAEHDRELNLLDTIET